MSIHSSARATSVTRALRSPSQTRTGFRNAFAFLLLALTLASAPAIAGETAKPLDLNRATAVQLEALPGIGEVKAAAILAIRDERGGFSSVAELESVRGIGPALVGKLRPLVTVGAAPKPASKKTSRK